jgi:peptidoglycan/xylan/chitin deacetylase (PgdA/CDA1 family)
MKAWIGVTLLLAALVVGLLAPALHAAGGSGLYSGQVAVLMYHHLDETAESSSTIKPELFRAQLQYLKSKHYHFITMNEFKAFLNGTGSVPSNAALVTFDDGYESFYKEAYPILRELGIPAHNFVITGDLEHPQETYIPSLSRDEIRTMLRESPGLISIGCHTDAMHGKLPSGEAIMTGREQKGGVTETDEAYRQRILNDTKTCLAKLNELSPTPVDTMAYPFGITTDAATRLVGEAGVRYAFTITPEMTVRGVDPLRIPRINAGSPNITPEGLHKTILHRIVRVEKEGPTIALQDAVDSLGGSFAQNGSELRFAWNGAQWTAQVGSNRVVREGTAGPIRLDRPIVRQAGRAVVSWNDLQQIFGPDIAYSPQTGKVTARQAVEP